VNRSGGIDVVVAGTELPRLQSIINVHRVIGGTTGCSHGDERLVQSLYGRDPDASSAGLHA